jgi:hypothetical protein
MAPERADLADHLRALLSDGYDISAGIPPQPHHAGTPGESLSVRTVQHGGHTIRIETRYRVFIDEHLFPDPIHVGNDGTVHYHGLPQYSVPSAVELGKLIVDRMASAEAPPPIGGDQPHHGHSHDHLHPEGGDG